MEDGGAGLGRRVAVGVGGAAEGFFGGAAEFVAADASGGLGDFEAHGERAAELELFDLGGRVAGFAGVEGPAGGGIGLEVVAEVASDVVDGLEEAKNLTRVALFTVGAGAGGVIVVAGRLALTGLGIIRGDQAAAFGGFAGAGIGLGGIAVSGGANAHREGLGEPRRAHFTAGLTAAVFVV